MQTIISKLAAVLGGLTLLLAAYLGGVVDSKDTVLGSAPAGLYATIASSSILSVGPEEVLTAWSTLSANNNCASRVISTVAKPIMISFGDRANYPAGNRATTTVSAIRGIYQAASTTVAYDGGLYGCGTVAIYGFDASSTITLSEFK